MIEQLLKFQSGKKSYGLAAGLVVLGVLVALGLTKDVSQEVVTGVGVALAGALAAAMRAGMSKVAGGDKVEG